MISDVLHEALVEIERYQRDCPDAYDPLKQEIESVKTLMNELCTCLDAAPGIIEEQDRLVADLCAAIRGLDMSDVLAAHQQLHSWLERTRRRGRRCPSVRSESDEGHSELYESLIHVEIPTSLGSQDIVDCYLRATMVAAGIRFDKKFFQRVMRQIAGKAASESPSTTSSARKRASKVKGGTTDGH